MASESSGTYEQWTRSPSYREIMALYDEHKALERRLSETAALAAQVRILAEQLALEARIIRKEGVVWGWSDIADSREKLSKRLITLLEQGGPG